MTDGWIGRGRRVLSESTSNDVDGLVRPCRVATRSLRSPDRAVQVDDGRMSSDTPTADPREQADPNSAAKPSEPSSKDDAEAAAARAKSPADDQPDDPDPS